MVGEKIKGRVMDVPENIKATAEDARKSSVYDALANFLSRFGRNNRKLIQK